MNRYPVNNLSHASWTDGALRIERDACAVSANMRRIGDGPDAMIESDRPDLVERIARINAELARRGRAK